MCNLLILKVTIFIMYLLLLELCVSKNSHIIKLLNKTHILRIFISLKQTEFHLAFWYIHFRYLQQNRTINVHNKSPLFLSHYHYRLYWIMGKANVKFIFHTERCTNMKGDVIQCLQCQTTSWESL